jgi:hypothetical protein
MAAIAFPLVPCGLVVAQDSLQVAKDDSFVTVRGGDRVVLRYKYADVPYKPYVLEFCTPDGVNIVRDSPSDHLHHHGLMFAIKVDGINFWEEHMAPGLQKVTDVEEPKSEEGRAVFAHGVDWVNPPEGKTLLQEARRIEVYDIEDEEASLLTWQCLFSCPASKPSASLTGSHYHGLGMRFLESMDKGGHFQNADGGTGVEGTNESKSRWCAYSAKADGKPVTVAMFDHPENYRHPATWFTMDQGFAYMSDTMYLHKEPVIVNAGKPLLLRYGVALWDGTPGPEAIESVYKNWLDFSGKK